MIYVKSFVCFQLVLEKRAAENVPAAGAFFYYFLLILHRQITFFFYTERLKSPKISRPYRGELPPAADT